MQKQLIVIFQLILHGCHYVLFRFSEYYKYYNNKTIQRYPTSCFNYKYPSRPIDLTTTYTLFLLKGFFRSVELNVMIIFLEPVLLLPLTHIRLRQWLYNEALRRAHYYEHAPTHPCEILRLYVYMICVYVLMFVSLSKLHLNFYCIKNIYMASILFKTISKIDHDFNNCLIRTVLQYLPLNQCTRLVVSF